MYWEKKIVVISLLILLVSGLFVYKFYFDLRGEELFPIQEYQSQRLQESIESDSWDLQSANFDEEDVLKDFFPDVDFPSDDVVYTWEAFTWDDLFEIQDDAVVYKILTWTKLYSWEIPILWMLDIVPRYILVDTWWTLFAYLGTGSIEVQDKITSIGWDIYEIIDTKKIEENGLFWDAVIYLNLPENKEKLVIMIVKFYNNEDIWLIQVDYQKYYGLKEYLKNLFINN